MNLKIASLVVVMLVVVSAVPAAAQQQGTRIRGTIEKVDGGTLMVKSAADGAMLKLVVPDNVQVTGQSKAALADVKVGSYVGVGAMPQADGSQRAVQVVIFPESMRGVGDGHRPWDRPNSTMTNGAVDTVTGVGGNEFTVKYKDGEKKIVVPADANITALANGDKTELKPGVAISAFGAMKQPDESYQAARLTVGRGGVVP